MPRSVEEAMATNEILQLVVFSVFFGIALTAIGKKGLSNWSVSLSHTENQAIAFVRAIE